MLTRTLFWLGMLALVTARTPLLAQTAAAKDSPHEGRVGELLMEVPETLEEMLARALRSNPDILLAEAKVREAQAELNQARLKVTQDVVSLFYQRKSLKSVRDELASQLEIAKKQYQTGVVSQEAIGKSILAQADAEAKVADSEARLRYALGLGGSRRDALLGSFLLRETKKPLRSRRAEVPEKFAAMLESSASTNFEWHDASLKDVLDAVSKTSGLPFVLSSGIDSESVPVTLSLSKASVADLLLAITDLHGSELCFVFRDYGVLVIDRDAAEGVRGATIPPDVPLVSD